MEGQSPEAGDRGGPGRAVLRQVMQAWSCRAFYKPLLRDAEPAVLRLPLHVREACALRGSVGRRGREVDTRLHGHQEDLNDRRRSSFTNNPETRIFPWFKARMNARPATESLKSNALTMTFVSKTKRVTLRPEWTAIFSESDRNVARCG